MTQTLGDAVSPADLALLEWLSRVAAVVDPEPPHLRELGKLALSVRRLDSEAAALVADSRELASMVRSGDAPSPRVLTFELADVVVEVQVTDRPAGRALLGVVEGVQPEPAARVDVETARADRLSAALDEAGRFEFADVPPGLVRLRVVAGDQDVTTDWVSL